MLANETSNQPTLICFAGGHFHRPTFVHARCRGRSSVLESMDEEGGDDAFLAVSSVPCP